MPSTLSQRDALLRLWVTPGVGPMLGRRLVEAFDEPGAILHASCAELQQVRGIGADKSRAIFRALAESEGTLEAELTEADRLGALVVTLGDPGYPPLLAQVPDAPLVLWYRGRLPGTAEDYPVAIVGSRRCSAYGVEQAERFSAMLGQSGLVIVSGGARGIDSAAHRAALRVGARTVAVLGCGLSQCYPPENLALFEHMVSAGGALVSDLPMRTSPAPQNFPARNRIIAAMSIGVLVIEAPKGSGALITARLAAEDYGREVMAVPGRIDSPASRGSNELIKDGGAGLVTEPSDVIHALESSARHLFAGTHGLRFGAGATCAPTSADPVEGKPTPRTTPTDLSESQRAIFAALDEPKSLSDLCRATGLEAHVVQAETTVLEIRRIVVRAGGGLLERR